MDCHWNYKKYKPITANYSLLKSNFFSLSPRPSLSFKIDPSFRDYLKIPLIFQYSRNYYQKKINHLLKSLKKEKKNFDLYFKYVGDLFFQNQKFRIYQDKKIAKTNAIGKTIKALKLKVQHLKRNLVKKQINFTELKYQYKSMHTQFLSLKEQYDFQLKKSELLAKQLKKKETQLNKKDMDDHVQLERLNGLSKDNQRYKDNLAKSSFEKNELTHCLNEKEKKLEEEQLIKQDLETKLHHFLEKEKVRCQKINILEKSLKDSIEKIQKVRQQAYGKYVHLIKKLKFQRPRYQKKTIDKLVRHSKKIEFFYHESVKNKDAVIQKLQKRESDLMEEIAQKEREKKFLFQSCVSESFSQELSKKGKRVLSLSELFKEIKHGTDQEKARTMLIFSRIHDKRVVLALQEFLKKATVPWLRQLAEEVLHFVALRNQYS